VDPCIVFSAYYDGIMCKHVDRSSFTSLGTDSFFFFSYHNFYTQ
jgi:hypothetical protein